MSNSNITKHAIQESFIELLNEKCISKISVRDITERCGINRNTFYYHYRDIIDLLEEKCSNDVDKIIQQYPELNSIEECMEAVMQFTLSNKRVVMHIYNSANRGVYVSSLWRVCEHVVKVYLDSAFPDVQLPESDRSLVVNFFKCSCFGMMIDWLSSDLNDDYIDGIHRILKNCKGIAELIISNMNE